MAEPVNEWVTPETQTASAIIGEVASDKQQRLREHIDKFRAVPPIYSHQELDAIRTEQYVWVMRLRELLNE